MVERPGDEVVWVVEQQKDGTKQGILPRYLANFCCVKAENCSYDAGKYAGFWLLTK